MYTLDSDILAILLAIISFTIPAINAVREKKKRQRAQEESDPCHFQEQEQQEPAHTCVEESPDELRRREMEELFSGLLGLEHKVEEMQEEPVEELHYAEAEEATQHEESQAAVEDASQEGMQATADCAQQVIAPATEEKAKSLKERIKDNPKDMVIFAEILKPKFKEFEN